MGALTFTMINKTNYLRPECSAEALRIEELLCESPVDGGLEDVNYEDWVI